MKILRRTKRKEQRRSALKMEVYTIYRLGYTPKHMVIRMRHTRAHRDNRRSHHALSGAALSVCPNCKAKTLNHHVCENCGQYKGRQVLDVHAKMEKKRAKSSAAADESGAEDGKKQKKAKAEKAGEKK